MKTKCLTYYRTSAAAALLSALVTVSPWARAAQTAPTPPSDQTTLPKTITGQQAPPLAVSPPPELEPQVVPDLPAGVTPVVASGTPLTLDQAVAIALQHQTAVGIAAQNAEAAAGRVEQARSALLPSVSVTSSVGHSTVSGGNVTTSSGDDYSATASARQLLFDFGRTASVVQSARALAAAQRADLARSRQDTAFNVSQAFFNLLQNTRLADIAQQTADGQKAHLDEARARFFAGSASEADVVTAQTNLAQAQLALSSARNNVQLSRANLNIAMGTDPRTPITPADITPSQSQLPDLNAMVDQALAARPEMLSARDNVSANEASVRAAGSGNLPAVVAEGSVGANGPSLSQSTKDSAIGVSLQWSIFDSGATHGAVREARANLAAARLTLTQVQQTVSNDVMQAYLNATNARQRLVTTNSEVANAQEALRLTEGRYRAGVAILLEVTDAQNALGTAQADEAQARYGLATALAALDHAVGRSVEMAK